MFWRRIQWCWNLHSGTRDKQNEGLIGGLLTAIMLSGSLLATLLGILFTAQFMPAWSWRIAFVLGSFIGIFGIALS